MHERILLFESAGTNSGDSRRRRKAAAAACGREEGRRNLGFLGVVSSVTFSLGIQLAVGPQPLWLRNHNSGLAQRIMVKRLATSPHDPLGITDSDCKNQLVMVTLQYGPFNPYIPIRSTTIGKSRVAIDPIAMHTSWRSNSDITSVTSIGYPRMSASGESSTTMHRILHASGSHPIPTPYDPNPSQCILRGIVALRIVETLLDVMPHLCLDAGGYCVYLGVLACILRALRDLLAARIIEQMSTLCVDRFCRALLVPVSSPEICFIDTLSFCLNCACVTRAWLWNLVGGESDVNAGQQVITALRDLLAARIIEQMSTLCVDRFCRALLVPVASPEICFIDTLSFCLNCACVTVSAGFGFVIFIGYPRMKASGESSTTKHRLLHASGPHPIPQPNDPKSENEDWRSNSPGRRLARRRPPCRAHATARATPSHAGRAMDDLMSRAGRATRAMVVGRLRHGWSRCARPLAPLLHVMAGRHRARWSRVLHDGWPLDVARDGRRWAALFETKRRCCPHDCGMVAHDIDVKRRSCSGRARALAAHVMLAPPCVLQWWTPAGRRSGEAPAVSWRGPLDVARDGRRWAALFETKRRCCPHDCGMVAHDIDVKRRSCSGRARALAAHVMLAPPCVLQWWPPAGRRSGESPAMS
ncbi:glutamate receptor 3.6-like [Dorcoceras hygrometricum]|uniref:Glutamate receptor 3.6-like n=1 Tax=Dorcoceras hygrometricum TaxID=472368 RepID=A0A2Z7BHG9_9LAMI|nr:glutamate receptor 3.6-like [Dorcoceras hygrometricum]